MPDKDKVKNHLTNRAATMPKMVKKGANVPKKPKPKPQSK